MKRAATIALQLYTIREEAARDFCGALRKVADIGYRAVEFAGYGGLSATELRKQLDELDLRAVATHVRLAELEADADRQIEYAAEIGAAYVVCPSVPEATLTGDDAAFGRLADTFARIGEKCKTSGLSFAYHNHAFEWRRMEDGRFALDRLCDALPAGLMALELDLYWVKKAGLDPLETLRRYAGRTALVHVKDMAEDGSFAEPGSGTIDWRTIVAAASGIGVRALVVEQDVCRRPPLESAKIGFEYLRSLVV